MNTAAAYEGRYASLGVDPNDPPTRRRMGVVACLDTPVSITNSATETQLLCITLPSGTLDLGVTIVFNLHGVAGTASAAPTATWRLRVGTTSLTGDIACAIAPTPAANLTDKAWNFQGLFTIRTEGASGACMANGFCLNELSTTLAEALKGARQTATAAVDTTVQNIIEVTFQWGTADAANTLACHNGMIWALKP
jgi:hypothetical protein